MLIKSIIFDFDGVIAQSLKVKTDAFGKLYKQYGDEVVNKVKKHHLAHGGMSRFEKFKYYHEFFLGKTIGSNEIEKLSKLFSKEVVDGVIDAPYVPGVLDYIKKCHSKYKLFISTGTPTNEIKQILEKRDLKKFFSGIYGSPEKKVAHLKDIICKYNYNAENLIFYGDAKTDMDAANVHNIPFILVSHGFNKDLSNVFNGKKIYNFLDL